MGMHLLNAVHCMHSEKSKNVLKLAPMHEHYDSKCIQRRTVRKVRKEEVNDGEKSRYANSVVLINLLSSVLEGDAK